ncbi:hypothetical protein NE599_12295 [[Clostridium] symbiosum]|nr:SpoIVB peptidase S55 domain-containing protein [[Clostridium] symbiosum]MCQ4989805.1 hypothetical protein [[Clostridium] symbiosum]
MSGTPIIQDGKLIGGGDPCVYPVLDEGYGIFIENMREH